ncbi:uncharacterized protein LOC143291506 [Babylonia areolata]|uniref:uncharacterized protein LOC143291506 n=1 Tax=Babylonia areolata TaxID=304850 RepID=UPI003FD48032
MSQQLGVSNPSVTWKEFVTSTYPNVLKATYCVPPLHFNRVPYQRVHVPGIPDYLRALVKLTPAEQKKALSAVPATNHSSSSSAPQQTGATTGQSGPGAAQPGSSPPAQSQSSDYSLWTTDPDPHSTPALVQESDMRDDFCQQYLLYNLSALAEHMKEVMFVLSSVNFQSYLSRHDAAAYSQSFPCPRDLREGKRGDFDFLVVHRHRGLLVAEMKSVGMQQAQLQMSKAQADDAVSKRLQKAVNQLGKGRRVATHLVSDVAPGLPVHTALFLPFVSRRQLLRVLTARPALAKDVRSCLGVNRTQEAAALTLCSDDLSKTTDPWHCPASVLSRLKAWWQRRMTSCPGPALTDDQYVEIIGRFVGPATCVSVHYAATPRLTVEVRTQGEAVSELGSRLARLVLTPEQTDLLTRAPPLAYLTGLPGTGKTVMLVLMGLVWCHRGWNVQVVSTNTSSLAASRLVYHQMKKTLHTAAASGTGVTAGDVFFRYLSSVREVDGRLDVEVQEIIRASPRQPVCVILDESDSEDYTALLLVKRLLREDPSVHVWAAGMTKIHAVDELQVEPMTRPLRSAPHVLREILRAVVSGHFRMAMPYSTVAVHSPADGFSPTEIWHRGADHTGDHPRCYQCGVEVAAALRDLGVGVAAHQLPNSPKPLQFRDVFILERGGLVEKNTDDPTRMRLSHDSAMVCGLKDEGIPLCVMFIEFYSLEGKEDEARWKKHLSNGCSVPWKALEGLGSTTFIDGKPFQETFSSKTSKEKELWRLHYKQGCEVESKEEYQRHEELKQKRRDEWMTKVDDMVESRHDHVIVTTNEYVAGMERKVVVVVMPNDELLQHIRMHCASRGTTHLILVRSVK